MAKVILSVKAALISTGIGSAAVIVKLLLPFFSEFIVSDVPSVYSLFVSYLRPPYLYLLINGIIISIVASSKLQRKSESESVSISQTPSPELVPVTDPAPIIAGVVSESQISSEAFITVSGYGGEENFAVVVPAVEAAPRGIDSIEVLKHEKVTVRDRPSTSKRFSQRKPVKTATDGKSLGVSRLRRQDTLESTWKTITEGRSMPLTRHLKKSDTWERLLQKDENTLPPPLPYKTMKKSETFHSDEKKENSEVSQQQAKIKREPSPSQDELNRRVEAFINKFNEEMRLQRQESLNQFQEMIRRGLH